MVVNVFTFLCINIGCDDPVIQEEYFSVLSVISLHYYNAAIAIVVADSVNSLCSIYSEQSIMEMGQNAIN